ncbi:YqgE/AlgH family protein [Neptuniibacter halophilus]|uniref:YqgE/AlgH family protein n=1 Tax=Neptuniibacter halophilus TaxID=651666 RepID=UPI00257261E3|nr:YqgE/AlgH family protein [Neptuniibacter halophilus]
MSSPCYSLRNQFLISMPHLNDQNFSQTVTYICDHSEYGAMGLVVNRPVGITLAELCDHLEIPCPSIANQQQEIYSGGPVRSDRGYVLHRSGHPEEWPGSHCVADDIYLSTSIDAIEAAAEGRFNHDYLVALGCAGWSPGQLEQEISDNVWLSCPANSDILFGIPAGDRLQAAASILGVNLDLLTAHPGHA